MIETLGRIGDGPAFRIFEIMKIDDGEYRLFEKGFDKPFNEKSYESPIEAYYDSCTHLKELKIRFLLMIPHWEF